MERWRSVGERLDRLTSGTPRRACVFLVLLFLAMYAVHGSPFRVLLVPPWALFSGKWAQDVAGLTQPGAGEYTLPKVSQAALALLREGGIDRFSMSPGIYKQREVRARIIEGAVPIMNEAEAPHLLLYKFETVPPGCRILAERDGMRLARCD